MPDFPYINARVRAMRSRLLDPARMEELLAAPTLDAFMQALTSTPYGPDLQEALTRYQGIQAVDEALARNFLQTTQKILRFADGRARTLIEILLLRWDLANLRALLRGKHTSRSEEEIASTVTPAGSLGDVQLRELARQPDIAAVAGTLEAFAHPLAPGLSAALADYLQHNDLLGLELALDRFYAGYILSATQGKGHNETTLRGIGQAQIDALNVKTAVKLTRVEEGLSPDARRRFFIPGGDVVDEKLFLRLSQRETAEPAWGILRVRGFDVADLPEDLTQFEKELDRLLLKRAAGLYLGDPLGIDIVVGYLTLKYNEVVNLRLIARSKLLGIPRDAVRREMVGV